MLQSSPDTGCQECSTYASYTTVVFGKSVFTTTSKAKRYRLYCCWIPMVCFNLIILTTEFMTLYLVNLIQVWICTRRQMTRRVIWSSISFLGLISFNPSTVSLRMFEASCSFHWSQSRRTNTEYKVEFLKVALNSLFMHSLPWGMFFLNFSTDQCWGLCRYQVRFALLEAAHYGTPQTRVRFFLLASKLGYTLPPFPTPLYTSSSRDGLQINLPHDLKLTPMGDSKGKVPFSFITIEEAISDLPYFDWWVLYLFKYYFNVLYMINRKNPFTNEQVLRQDIPLLEVDCEEKTCGFTEPAYRHTPRSRYQQLARRDEINIKSLQHFTRPLPKKTVAR